MRLIDSLVVLIIGLSFFYGLAELSGVPPLYYQLLLDLLVITLLFVSASGQDWRIRAPGIKLFVLLTAVFFISGLLNGSELFTAYRMYRNILIPYLFFLAVLNSALNETRFKKINGILFMLMVLQIGAAIVKYAIWGVREGGPIGTFATAAGQGSTIVPLTAILFLLALFLLYRRHLLYIWLMLGFLFVAWGGGKRAIVFILPVFFVLIYLLYHKMERNRPLFSFRNLFVSVVLLALLFPAIYLLVIFTPTLNPEKKMGGSFDLNHLITYSFNYHFGDKFVYRENQDALLGRIATLKRALELTSKSCEKTALGYGPAAIYAAKRGDERLLRFGVVEFQTGLSFYLMSIGIAGALLLVLLYWKTGFLVLRYFRVYSPYWRALCLSVFISFFIFMFDFFVYSVFFTHAYIPKMVFFYLAAVLLNLGYQMEPIKAGNRIRSRNQS